jgi:probable rRNA maturation factor
MVIMQKRVAGLNEDSLDRFVARAKRTAGLRGAVTVLVTTSRELRRLNVRFRGKDKPTDVLSFPAQIISSSRFAGDVAISADIAAQNARRLGHSAAEEVKILVLHGVLHLAGYDHETDNGRMARREAQMRKQLGLPDALIERSATQAGRTLRVASASSSQKLRLNKPPLSPPVRRRTQ